jgi:prolyl oligopeptidase
MPHNLISAPPSAATVPVTDVLHGIPVSDPYRWLEDDNSPETRQWLAEQHQYARSYLDSIPGREDIRKRIRELLAVETCDSFHMAAQRYIFRKRLATEEQSSIYLREGADGEDERLIDPVDFGTSPYTAVRPVRLSPDGRFLLFETKQGGERTGTFSLFDIESRSTLPEVLPRGYLRGFAFAPEGKSAYYVHEELHAANALRAVVRHHTLGTDFAADREVFRAKDEGKIRLALVSDAAHLGILVYHFLETTRTDFHLMPFKSARAPELVIADAEYSFMPRLAPGKILAVTNRHAPNGRIVELRRQASAEYAWTDIVPEQSSRIHEWIVTRDRILVSYVSHTETRVSVYGFTGQKIDEWPPQSSSRTLRFVGSSSGTNEVFLQTESFTDPPAAFRCAVDTNQVDLWSRKTVPFDSERYEHRRIWYTSKDGTPIPMFLMGCREVVAGGCHAAILTSYGGYGVPMTPQFSVFVAYLIEQGCLFALPGIRGGSEFGAQWHESAKARKRQTAYDDFLAAAQWLVATGRTTPDQLAIFGGSNSGLLVGAALTQRPDLFRAALSIAPMFDMLRYHLFSGANAWRDEFGCAEDPEDFRALAGYSPYHQIREQTTYPAVMIVSGDADQTCHPSHARKMTARLQAANSSRSPILLDYSPWRGHSPVLPLTHRVEALTDRVAFLCDQLGLSRPEKEG